MTKDRAVSQSGKCQRRHVVPATKMRTLKDSPALSSPRSALKALLLVIITLSMSQDALSFTTPSVPPTRHKLSSVSTKSSSTRKTQTPWDNTSQQPHIQYRPIPTMPSQLFQELALSQLELLASSLASSKRPGDTKVKSMALYLPQENVQTGQLEFLPAVLFPHPKNERIFIANEAESGVAPTLPRTLTKLPGFAHAQTLIPGYPMVSSGNVAGVGVVEEVFCDLHSGSRAAALSVPLFSGPQTVGVLLVSPAESDRDGDSVWTESDREQVARAAKSLSLALTMDQERSLLELQNLKVKEALSDSLHQLKNPVQALRTYGKLLQRRIADTDDVITPGMMPQLLELAEHLMVQSDRLADRLKPVDTIVNSIGGRGPPYALQPAPNREELSLVPWGSPSLSWENDTLTFARETEPNNNRRRSSAGSVESSSVSNNNGQSRRATVQSTVDMNDKVSAFGDFELEMTFMDDVLGPVVSAFRAIATERGLSFVVDWSDELPGVMAHAEALQEALTNILDNAFKYVVLASPESGLAANPNPQIRLSLLPNEFPLEPGVTLLVSDNGPGVKPEDREAIFDRGYRSEATQNVEGTGIGLHIAKALVERMGGSLRVADTGEQQGTTMKVVLYRRPNVERSTK